MIVSKHKLQCAFVSTAFAELPQIIPLSTFNNITVSKVVIIAIIIWTLNYPQKPSMTFYFLVKFAVLKLNQVWKVWISMPRPTLLNLSTGGKHHVPEWYHRHNSYYSQRSLSHSVVINFNNTLLAGAIWWFACYFSYVFIPRSTPSIIAYHHCSPP